ncbi:hypothetical protein E3N88_06995 [Mikania micrantha]|uniref:Uncharacterized protein n=1 Tax=Mikania micrantha TaxID=192012 RepID=A0A5N6PT43_9ASTR|nr:hypothetical protein E3N88_06995 [Mikania micrantha]
MRWVVEEMAVASGFDVHVFPRQRHNQDPMDPGLGPGIEASTSGMDGWKQGAGHTTPDDFLTASCEALQHLLSPCTTSKHTSNSILCRSWWPVLLCNREQTTTTTGVVVVDVAHNHYRQYGYK